jgi:hypothetical protein
MLHAGYGLCAKAVTQANNIKAGSVCGDTDFIRACLENISPQSRGYASHSGDAFYANNYTSFFSSRPDIQAAAATPADTAGVCGR